MLPKIRADMESAPTNNNLTIFAKAKINHNSALCIPHSALNKNKARNEPYFYTLFALIVFNDEISILRIAPQSFCRGL